MLVNEVPSAFIFEENSIINYIKKSNKLNKNLKDFIDLMEKLSDKLTIQVFLNKIEKEFMIFKEKNLASLELNKLTENLKSALDL